MDCSVRIYTAPQCNRIHYLDCRIVRVLRKKLGKTEDVVPSWCVSHGMVRQGGAVNFSQLLKQRVFQIELAPNMSLPPLCLCELFLHCFLVRSTIKYFNQLVCSFALAAWSKTEPWHADNVSTHYLSAIWINSPEQTDSFPIVTQHVELIHVNIEYLW